MKKFFLLVALLVAVPGLGVTPFSLPWMNAETTGTNFSSVDYKDGIFVVEAYFLDCPYCNYNAKNVNEMASKFANEPRVHVLDVGIDRNDSQYATWIQRHKPNHPVLKDASRQLIKQLGTTGYPSTYVIDCKGNVKYKSAGEWESKEKTEIADAIDELLQDECN